MCVDGPNFGQVGWAFDRSNCDRPQPELPPLLIHAIPAAQRIAQLAAEKLHTEPLPPPPPPSSTDPPGALPLRYNGCVDTCASYDDDDDAKPER